MDDKTKVENYVDMQAAVQQLKDRDSKKIVGQLYKEAHLTWESLIHKTRLPANRADKALEGLKEQSMVLEQGGEFWLTQYGALLFEATEVIRKGDIPAMLHGMGAKA